MPELIVKLGENIVHKYFFDKEVLSIGRARDNDIVIENLSVSRNHARIRQVDDKYILTDLNSANGTYVNNVRVNKTDLCHEDVISIGKHQIHFIDKALSDEQIISDAFGAERTMIVDKTPVASLSITKGKQEGQEFKITKTETYIGRSGDNDIRLHDWFVSKKHAMILRQGQNFFIKDLKSWRGTMINGKFTRESALKDSDKLQLGSTIMTFNIATEEDLLKITGRVPEEIGEEEVAESPPEEMEAGKEEVAVSQESPEIKEKIKREEEEFAKMQAAWEPLEGEAEKQEREEEVAPEDEKEEVVIEQEAATEEVAITEEPAPKSEAMEEAVAVEEHPPQGGEKTPVEAPEELPEWGGSQEVELWLKALNNPSPIIRKNAAHFLKKLTGKDYDYK